MEGPLSPAPPRRDVSAPVVSMGVGARKSKYHQIKYFYPQGEMLSKLQTLKPIENFNFFVNIRYDMNPISLEEGGVDS